MDTLVTTPTTNRQQFNRAVARARMAVSATLSPLYIVHHPQRTHTPYVVTPVVHSSDRDRVVATVVSNGSVI